MNIRKIVAIGDSITWGFPFGHSASWVAKLAQAFPAITWINEGENGDTYDGIYNRLNYSVLAHKPEICLVTAGINDILCEYNIKEISTILRKIISSLHDNAIMPILGIPVNPPLPDLFDYNLKQVSKEIKTIASQEKLSVLSFEGLKPEDYADDVHPNQQGYAKMGQMAVQFFKDFLL
jgi:lysophospholipase L1-like esterase